MVLPRVGVGGLLHGAYNYTGCYPRQVVFRRRSIRATGSEPTVFPDRLPRGQQVITSHLLFRIIPQHVAVFQPRIDPLCRERQISYQSEIGAERALGVWLRGFEHLHAPFQLPTTLPDCVVRDDGTRLWPYSAWSISAVFGHCLEAVFQCHPSDSENRQKSTKVGHWAVTVFRVRAPAGICNR